MRYAVYWAPGPDTALWQLGSRWLGRDAASGSLLPGGDDSHAALTADPRRYGLHVTLKAPIALADGITEQDLHDRLRRLAARFTPFSSPPWVVADVSGFMALIPDPRIEAGRPRRLHALADACVLALEPLRRHPAAAEIARRRAGLTDQRALRYADQFGYPWVLDLYFAHMTLTQRVAEDARGDLARRLRRHFAPVERLWPVVSELALFVEERPGEPLMVRKRFPLGSAIVERDGMRRGREE